MAIETGIRDLKIHLSAYLRRVKAGETLIITERGKPIGRITPIPQTSEEWLASLIKTGQIAWNGEPLPEHTPPAQSRGEQTVAELLLENRT
jgi:prevent-host-death family protein